MNAAIELLTRILCDTMPEKPADGTYLYCSTIDNQASLFHAVKMLTDPGDTNRILILDAQRMSGYPGGSQCRKRLQEFGLADEQIEWVPIEGPTSLNTLIESEALIRFARNQNYHSLVVTSPPFHQLRAFMTAVTVAMKTYPELSIFSFPGTAMPWMEKVTHSQGTLQAPRRQLIQEELIRIDTYQNKGDLARFEDVLDYLNQRKTNS